MAQKDKSKEELAEEIKLLQRRIAELETPASKQQQIIGITSTERDITERKKMEERCRQCEEKYRSLYGSSRDAIMILEPPDWFFTACNPAAIKMFAAKDEAEFMSKTPHELSPEYQPDGKPSMEKALEMINIAMREGSHYFEWTHKRIRGEAFFATVLLTKVAIAGKTFLQATVMDITERKRVEENLVRLNLQKELILSSAAEGIIGLDLQGNHIFVNPSAAKMLGYKAEELLGRPSHSTWHHTKLDGSPYPREECQIYAAYRDGVVHRSFAEVFWRKDGSSFPVEYASTPIYEQGRLAGAVVMFQDITGRKKAEADLNSAQQRLIQSDKMATIGSFSAGIAHEVKNPLGVILNGAEFLEVKLPRYDAEVTSTLDKIKEASLRANFVLQALLQFARPSEFKTEPVKPEDLVKLIMDLMSNRAHYSGINIITEIGNEPSAVLVDKNQIQQVIFNAVKNSMEAMADGGTITIRTYKSFDKELFRGKPAFVIEITDTGHGISKENTPKLFEPFFTTKEEGKDTGLGLVISKSIVENHGGRLLIDSVAGKGTSVRIALPLGE